MNDLSDLLLEFSAECQDILAKIRDNLANFGKTGNRLDQLKDIARGIHTIKGSASMFDLKELTQKAHKLENFLQKFKDNPEKLQQKSIDSILKFVDTIEHVIDNIVSGEKQQAAPQTSEALPINDRGLDGDPHVIEDEEIVDAKKQHESNADDAVSPAGSEETRSPVQTKKAQDLVRVPLDRLQKNLDTVTEVFLIRNQMSFLVDSKLRQAGDVADFLQDWDSLDNALRKTVSELEHIVMGMRMMPVKNLFQRMEKAIRTYLESSDKKIAISIAGENTELDKKILDYLAEPLIHLIRNAMDHGIESSEVRQLAGKSGTGRIALKAEVRGNEVIITIADDGKGIDGAAILESAMKKGFNVSHIKTPDQAVDLIFLPGFSTNDEVSEVSGRGVGMDAVKTYVEGIGGRININTAVGTGSTFSLVLPLGMSLIPTILSRVNQSIYAFSSSDIVETLQVHSGDVRVNGSRRFLKYKSQLIRTFFLEETLSMPTRSAQFHIINKNLSVCIVQSGSDYIALVVGEFLSNTEIAAKLLPAAAPKIPYITSASILVTGEPVLVISMGNLCTWLQQNHEEEVASDFAA